MGARRDFSILRGLKTYRTTGIVLYESKGVIIADERVGMNRKVILVGIGVFYSIQVLEYNMFGDVLCSECVYRL